MKKFVILVATAIATPALACAPAPSCWISEGPAYLRDICRNYAKAHRTVADIKGFLDEPEKIGDFVAACKKQGVAFKDK
ncbi:hypothetical protein ACVW1C_000149 [Bradyrhizobium sp. USDA 4011]